MSKKIETAFLILITIIFFSCVFISSTSAAEPVKVLILPFNIHSDKDLSFLRKGVSDMLASRLALKDRVVVIDRADAVLKPEKKPAEINTDAAVALAEEAQADYVLFGSLTVLGDTISTDAQFFDMRQKQPVLTFSELGDTSGQVISHINLLASRIKEEVFGRKPLASRPAPLPSTEAKESDSVSRKHPEKILDKASGEESMLSEDSTADGEATATLWKTPNFKTEIKGVALGDVDGDARNEIVFISSHKLFVYRHANRRFAKIAEIQGESQNSFIGVDVADINTNGRSEIFATSLSDENRLASFVLEWNGTEFKRLAERESWYYRVINVTNGGPPVLVGQKGGYDSVFRGGIYELLWENGQYKPGSQQSTPNWLNVYGFTYGDVFNNGQVSVLALRRDGILSILNQDNQEEWASNETYGGSNIYLLAPADLKTAKSVGRQVDPTAFKGLYLQQRILLTDLDKDKQNEVIVVKNHDSVRGLLERYKHFSGGHFEALVWDNVGLRLKWKTRKFSGYISDYAVGDLDNDGTDELVFAVIAKSDTVITEARSHIVSWRLEK